MLLVAERLPWFLSMMANVYFFFYFINHSVNRRVTPAYEYLEAMAKSIDNLYSYAQLISGETQVWALQVNLHMITQ